MCFEEIYYGGLGDFPYAEYCRAGPRACPYTNGNLDRGNHKGLPLQRCHDFWFTSINRFNGVHEDIMCAL